MPASDVPAVVNAVRIVERLAQDWPAEVSTGSLINELKLNRSTCYNILATLQRAGWVTSRGDRAGWSLGPHMLALTGVPPEAVGAIVQQSIDQVSRSLGYVVFVAQRQSSGEFVVLAKAERGVGVRVTVSVGDTFPFSAPALMQAFLAWQPAETVDRLINRFGLVAFTEHTVADRPELHEVLATVRKRGYSTSIRQFDMAQSGIAAPVFDAQGNVAMLVCSLAFSSELTEANAASAGLLIRECAQDITNRIGGQPLPDSADSGPAEA
ncbi:MAG: IclR family transcriptional regulator [Micromonosporaceae bacterium]